ncbi:MAG TPA: CDP-alcohol phosphatidyltransferase family protein [Gaiellaceae bacterium]|nr:CDP-alcohol phosphatidyltransferase family protein [Gaiellaceae bacterium]
MRVKQGYTTGARSLASRSVTGLARTRVTPNALTAAGVTLCVVAAVIVPFENRDHLLYYWLGAALFVVGSVLDILDGALARAGGKSTPFGAFLDSTTDRIGEGAMLAAIALVFARSGNDTAAVVPFENRNEILVYWLAATLFVVGSVLDILDGALARAGGKSSPFGAFLDSTTDRVGEGAMLAAIALVFARQGKEWAVVVDVVAVAGSFLVPYARAKAEAIGLRGDVGLGSRAERVVVITAGLVLAPWGVLPWAIALLAATAWLTVVQRILHVRKQLSGGTSV